MHAVNNTRLCNSYSKEEQVNDKLLLVKPLENQKSQITFSYRLTATTLFLLLQLADQAQAPHRILPDSNTREKSQALNPQNSITNRMLERTTNLKFILSFPLAFTKQNICAIHISKALTRILWFSIKSSHLFWSVSRDEVLQEARVSLSMGPCPSHRNKKTSPYFYYSSTCLHIRKSQQGRTEWIQ